MGCASHRERVTLLALDRPWPRRHNEEHMQGRVFHYETTIRERHLDHFGHVNNAKYLELFEEARWDLIAQSGRGLDWVLQRGLGPVILGVNVKFRKELLLRETVRIESRVADYRKCLGYFEQKIFNAKGVLCTEAEFVFSIFDLHRRRMVPPDAQWVQLLGMSATAAPETSLTAAPNGDR
jgi:acyl-CoA thioester hydrolase